MAIFNAQFSEFCLRSGDWGKLEIPRLAGMSLIRCYCMLQNARLGTFTVSELLRENQQGEGGHVDILFVTLRILLNSWETFGLVRGIEPLRCVLSL